MKRHALALLAVFTVAACDQPIPTQTTLGELPLAMAPTEDHGNGVQFDIIDGSGTLAVMSDADGNTCEIGRSDQDGAKTRNDFQRVNKDGTFSIHLSDPAAPLTVQFEGQTYTGVGHATAVGTTNTAGDAYRILNISSTAAVTDGLGGSFRASCGVKLRDSFAFDNADIRVK